MSECNKTKRNLRKDQKVKNKSVGGQTMSEYPKTELNLGKNQKVKKNEGEGSNYVGIY